MKKKNPETEIGKQNLKDLGLVSKGGVQPVWDMEGEYKKTGDVKIPEGYKEGNPEVIAAVKNGVEQYLAALENQWDLDLMDQMRDLDD